MSSLAEETDLASSDSLRPPAEGGGRVGFDASVLDSPPDPAPDVDEDDDDDVMSGGVSGIDMYVSFSATALIA